MILLACIVCARIKYIQCKDILHKGSQRPQIGPVSQNRITYFGMYNLSTTRNRQQFLDLISFLLKL